MSTIKSNAEDLTLEADGANKIEFKTNDSVGIDIDSDGNMNTNGKLINGVKNIISSSVTYTVGGTGDFTTITQALIYLSNKAPQYITAGIKVTLELQAGFVMAEQVLNRGLNLGWVTITGVDTETSITHTALTTDFTTDDYGFASYPAFGVSKGGCGPTINQLFNMGSPISGAGKHGVMAIGAGSSIDVMPDAGVKNAGENGIYALLGSIINASGVNASGAETHGIYALSGSAINAQGANASGAGTNGIFALSGSTINANDANASGAGTYGIFAANTSNINASGADASGAGTYGIVAVKNSTINAQDADADRDGSTTSNCIYANNSSTINAQGANASGATNTAITVLNGSSINAIGATTTGSGTAYSQTINTLTSQGIIYV